jgi:glutaredoxin
MNLKGFAFFIFLFLSTNAVAQQTYRYVDEAGNIFFAERLSDIPSQYLNQVVPPTPPPYRTEKEKRKWERQQALLARKQAKEEARAERQVRLGKPKSGKEAAGGGKRGDDIEQVNAVEVFVSPSCTDCPKLEKFLKRNKIHYKRYDIVKSQKAFEIFDRLGAGSKLPVTKIGKKIIKGIQPDAILEAATKLKVTKDNSDIGTL